MGLDAQTAVALVSMVSSPLVLICAFPRLFAAALSMVMAVLVELMRGGRVKRVTMKGKEIDVEFQDQTPAETALRQAKPSSVAVLPPPNEQRNGG